MFAEDLSVFLLQSDFAVAVTWNSTQLNGIFDAAYVNPFDVESAAPVVLVRSDQVSGAAHGQAVIISGTTYTIRGVQPDGTGMTLLKLETQEVKPTTIPVP